MNATTHIAFTDLRQLARPAALGLIAFVAACGGSGGVSSTESEEELVARARGIHERVITLDTHDDISPANFTVERNYTMDLGNQVNLPKMEAARTPPSGKWQKKRFKLAEPYLKQVLNRIQEEGPLCSKDFEHDYKGSTGGWGPLKPAKLALDVLYSQGDLMISARRNFHRVFDLRERVLPDGLDTSMPSPASSGAATRPSGYGPRPTRFCGTSRSDQGVWSARTSFSTRSGQRRT